MVTAVHVTPVFLGRDTQTSSLKIPAVIYQSVLETAQIQALKQETYETFLHLIY